MKYGMYTIRDKVAEAGGYPFCSRNNGTAARAFRDFIQKQNAMIDPNDFELLQLGIWDEETCVLSTTSQPIKIEVALPPSVEIENRGMRVEERIA